MSLFIASLNSGSNGNCYFVGNSDEAVLIDCGLSCRETEKRLKRLGLSMEQVQAIFISHEHSDHINGVATISKKYKLPVYITNNTLLHGKLKLQESLAIHFNAYENISIGSLEITGFPKHHDACDPHSFIVGCNGVRVGIFTDIGEPCEHVVNHFRQCHAAFLETNYDEEMLEKGRYPYHLKKRIRNGRGHLSNMQALRLFTEHKPRYMTHLILSHLSANNNTPDKANNLFIDYAGNTQIIVAPRDKETEVFHIKDIPGFVSGQIKLPVFRPANEQLRLF